MPKKLHENLSKEAKSKGLKGERKDAYIYGTMSKVDKAKKSGKPKKGGY